LRHLIAGPPIGVEARPAAQLDVDAIESDLLDGLGHLTHRHAAQIHCRDGREKIFALNSLIPFRIPD
jgi:hypothetical protein